MQDEITTGARLRTLRRWRGMTLTEVADLSGLSTSFLSRAERGQRALDRRSHIAALAEALRVSETDLVGGPHLGKDPVQSGPHLSVPFLRAALTGVELGESAIERPRRSVDALAELVAGTINEAGRINDWAAAFEDLPSVIEDLHHHVAEALDERTLRLALATLLDATQHAAGPLRLLGYDDLGYIAAARAAEAAAMLDDPIARGKAMYMLARPNGAGMDAVRVAARRAEREIDRLEPHATDSEGRQVLGMLCLNAALVAATSLDGDSARSWMNRAEDLGRRVPDDLTNWQSFSTTNVKVWQVKIEVELGESGGKVLALANDVNADRVATYPARHVNFLGEVGRGLARSPKTREDAVRWFQHAEQVGPQRIRNNTKIRDAIAVMLEQARVASMGRDLRGLAARVGVPH